MIDAIEELRSLLADIVPADDEETSDLAKILALLSNPKSEFRNPKSPLDRFHFDPGHITASAFIVHPPLRRLLLHHHRRLDKWLQMGGHLDPGERVTEAALREAREESGLPDLRLLDGKPFDVDIHPIPAGKGEPPHSHFDVRFVVVTDRPDELARQESESIDLAWFPLPDAAERMNEPESRRAVVKIERMLESMSR